MCFRYCVNKETNGHEKEYNKYVLTAKAVDILMDGNPCEGETGSAFVTQRHYILGDHTPNYGFGIWTRTYLSLEKL